MSSFTPPPNSAPNSAPTRAPGQPSTPAYGTPVVTHGQRLIDGPQWYRDRIRKMGPLLALILPAIVGGLGLAALKWSEASWSGSVGLLGGVLGAPGLLIAGAPFGDRGLYPAAIAGSVVIWLLIGLLASRRATRHPMATWSDFWRHCVPLTIGVWVGAGVGLLAAALVVGDGIL